MRPGSFGLLAHPTGITQRDVLPAAPYDPNPYNWPTHDWYDRHTGTSTRVVTIDVDDDPEQRAHKLGRGDTPVAILADILHTYQHRPEHKSLAPDRQSARRGTTGLLTRRPVSGDPTHTRLTGKEGNNLQQRVTGSKSPLTSTATTMAPAATPGRSIANC
jgi:hypothetical protein